MEIENIDASRKETWDAFVQSHPDSIAWHSYGWSEIMARWYPHQFFPLVASDEGGIRGVLPLYRLASGKGSDALISIPYVVAGGILSRDPEVQNLLLDRAIRLAEQEGAKRIVLKQYKIRIEADLRTDENYFNRELDLDRPLENVWDELSAANREQVSRSKEKGPRLDFPSTDVGGFYDLLLRHSHRNGVPCVSKAWVRTLFESGFYSVALFYHGDVVVAGTMIKEFKNEVSFPLSCVQSPSREGLSHMYGLYWELITQLAGRGVKIFHSGRVPKTEDTDIYRLGWGGVVRPYFNQYHPSGGGETEYTRKRGWKRRALSFGWRCLPRPIVDPLGPYIARRYP